MSTIDQDQDWQAERTLLLDIHRNVADTITLRAIRLFEILERDDYVGVSRISVLHVINEAIILARWKTFVISSSKPQLWTRCCPELMDNAEPGLALLSAYGAEYGLSESL